jgi:arylsulfatase A-like enzyme
VPIGTLSKLLAGLALLASFTVHPDARAAVSRPNILFILADDLGYMDIGANNPDTFYETPHIDSLAKTGMRFTAGYAACPVCSPTRASILTGKYPPRTGITDFIGAAQPDAWKRPTRLLPAPYQGQLALSESTLAKAFKAQGYPTFFAGKWHLGPKGFWPEQQGFDINIGGCAWGHPKTYFSPYGNPKLVDGPVGEVLPHRLAQETIKFIEANRAKPFLAYLSFYSVHIPLMTEAALQKKYEAKAKARKPSGPEWGQEGQNKVRLVQNHPVYAGMIEAMDSSIGEVLAAVDRLGLASNTIVVFTSDNGGLSTAEKQPTSNLPLRGGKGWLYEGGIREPWIVRVPGLTKPGSTCYTPVLSTDFFPTLLALAGVAPMADWHPDGVSFAPLLAGGVLPPRPLFWHYPHYGNQGGAPGGAIRDGDWKLIEWYEASRLELFNLREDIGETRNLAEANPAKVKALHAKLIQWRKDLGALMPTPNPNFGRKAKLERPTEPAKPVEE